MRAFNSQWVEGKTVKEVVTSLRQSNTRYPDRHIDRIIFTDGSAMYFLVGETDDEYNIIPRYLTPDPKLAGRQPDLTAKVYLVEHGYQIDFLDEKGKPLGSQCRDFGGSYSIKKLVRLCLGSIINAMHNLENAVKEKRK